MRRVHLALILVLCAGQATAATVPFTYCLEDGKFCCEGWAAEFCRVQESGPGPELTASPECSDVSVGFCGIQAGTRSHLPHPELTPVPGSASLLLRPPAANLLRHSGETRSRGPSDPVSLLDSVILLL